MKIHSHIHTVTTQNDIELIDLTNVVNDQLAICNINNGVAIITSQHTTTALTINEYEERLLHDIREYLKQLAPSDKHYLHNDIHLRDCPPSEPENAHSHIMAMLLSSSESIPIVAGELQLGQWQSVILFELDGPRERTVTIQIMGES